MATETLSFDITGRDAGASTTFRRVADSATLAARGARLSAQALEQQRKASDASARASISLANADKILEEAERGLNDETLRQEFLQRKAAAAQKATAAEVRRLAAEQRTAARGAGGGGFARGLAGGIGPGILGLSPRLAAIIAGGGLGLAGLPALAAAGGALGIGGLAARSLIGNKQQQGPLYQVAQNAAKAFSQAFDSAAKGLEKPLRAIFAQIPQFVRSIAPQLKQLFAAVGPLLGPVVHGFESLIRGVLPGFVSLMRAARPAVQALAQILGTLGKDIGSMFSAFAPVIRQSALIFKALSDVVSGLFPVIGKLAAIMARSLGPVFSVLGKIIESMEPVLVTIGRIIAGLASAVIGDLVSAFGAVATLVKNIAPALKVLAGALSGVFNLLENAGVFAVLGDALEKVAKPLAKLVSALITGLAPILPPVIKLVSALAGDAVKILAGALTGILPVLTQFVTVILKALAPILPPLVTAITQVAGALTKALLTGLKAMQPQWRQLIGSLADVLVNLAPILPPVIKLTGLLLTLALKAITPLIPLLVKMAGFMTDATVRVIKLIGWVAKLASGVVTWASHWRTAWGDIKNVAGDVVSWLTRTFGSWVTGMLRYFGLIIHGAANAFGWIPVIGPKLKTAEAAFDSFHNRILAALNIQPKPIALTFSLNLPAGVSYPSRPIKGHAAGTPGAAAGWALVGERGPELVHFGGGEQVLSHPQTRRVLGYANGTFGLSVNFPPVAPLAAAFASAAHVIGTRIGAVISRHLAPILPVVPGGAPSGGSAAANAAIARRIFPWPASQWPSFNAVEMREAGYSLTAQNPVSAAYGMAQFINGPSEYYAYGGNPFTAVGQLTAMFNYIRQRYGTPAAAWAHEVNFGWYDRGGYLKPGLNLAWNGTGRPEPVGAARGGGTVVINVQAPNSHPREIAKYLADILNQGATSGVRLRRSILSANG